MPFAPDKAFVAASNQQVKDLAQRELPRKWGVVVFAGRSLGVDHCPSSQHTAGVWTGRFATSLRRKKRLHALNSAAGRETDHVFSTGITPASLYAAEVFEPPPALLQKLRSWAVEARGLPVKGHAHDITWALPSLNLDPLFKVRLAPLIRYHQEWWAIWQGEKALCPNMLVKAWEVANVSVTGNEAYTNRIRNPICAALRSAMGRGLDTNVTHSFLYHDGSTIDLATGPPALLKWFSRKRGGRGINILVDNKVAVRNGNAQGICLEAAIQVVISKAKGKNITA